MIRCINTYRRKSPDGLVLNVYQGSFFYSNEAPCTDLLSSTIATKYTGKPSEFWNTNQDTSFINYRGFTKSHLETTFDQKTAIEQLFIDLQETFCHYQKNVATNLYELNNVYYATFEYIRSMPSLVYDDKKKDWVISDSELETVVVVNNISVREYRKANSILTSPMPDYVFRIVQALHYFNNLVRAEKVPD